MSINSILCKLFELDINGDIDIESLISQMLYILFWGGLVIIIMCLTLGGYIYCGYYIINEESHENLHTNIKFLGYLCTMWAAITSLFLAYVGWSKLWDKIKTIKVAHCPINEKDETLINNRK